MIHPMALVVGVILAAGAFGGLVNFYLTQAKEGSNVRLRSSVALGIAASFLVPLFLNMISSNLLDVINGNPTTPPDLSKLFVFAGFCLVAAISSKAFINTLSDRILREARETRREVEATKDELAQVQAVIDPIVAKETESDDGELKTERLLEAMRDDSPEERLLQALIPKRWTLRSLSGLAKETELDRVEVVRLLSELTERGLVGQKTGKNGPRWFLTESGRRAAGLT